MTDRTAPHDGPVTPGPDEPASAEAPGPGDHDRLRPGTRVEVRTRLDSRRWARGFVVEAGGPDGYVLRRASDGTTMPVRFGPEDVRAERKRGTWWY